MTRARNNKNAKTSNANKQTPPRRRRRRHCRTQKNGLPLPIQKQLILDLEKAGGVFARIDYNARPDYGLPNTPERRRVRNKIRVWKKLKPDEYKALVEEDFDIVVTHVITGDIEGEAEDTDDDTDDESKFDEALLSPTEERPAMTSYEGAVVPFYGKWVVVESLK